jgi:uncharacterized FAD-dependent dehydrogenase
MLRIRNIILSPEEDKPNRLKKRVAVMLGLHSSEIRELRIVRRSIDARKRDKIRLQYTVDVSVEDESAALKILPLAAAVPPEEAYTLPKPDREPCGRPIVAGFGPAGMFIALALAEAGLRPLVLERGLRVEDRREKVQLFREKGILDTECNVQFGEGGAGTFSDGKLNTGISGPEVSYVLRRLAEFGAQQRILWDAAPHVGTDVLGEVVANLRNHILSLGGEIRFGCRMEDILLVNGIVRGITAVSSSGVENIACGALFLAVGHSARDTFEMLLKRGAAMEPKPFAMGVRIEHLQKSIDQAQYGAYAGHEALGPAPYKMAVHLPDGIGVYTFCMCPGGYVMAAASEACGVVTNGMSYSGRAGENANSALLVSLKPEQFPEKDPLGGMRWQRLLEQRAYRYGGSDYAAPAQTLGDFLERHETGRGGRINPSYAPGVRFGDLDQVLPEVITAPLRSAVPLLERKLRGFADPQAVLTAPETRSSSPVRILRGDDRQAFGMGGIYPCGEGAGWAGGIVSAAVDGLRSAQAYLLTLQK